MLGEFGVEPVRRRRERIERRTQRPRAGLVAFGFPYGLLERFPLMLKRILRLRNSWRIRKA